MQTAAVQELYQVADVGSFVGGTAATMFAMTLVVRPSSFSWSSAQAHAFIHRLSLQDYYFEVWKLLFPAERQHVHFAQRQQAQKEQKACLARYAMLCFTKLFLSSFFVPLPCLLTT